MAARKKRKFLSDDWRMKIQTSMIINRLQDHIKITPQDPNFSKKYMDKSQVSAALGLLKKTLPDLQTMELSGKDGERLFPEKITVELIKPK